MKGCRPLEDNQINRLLSLVKNTRDKLMIMVGINTGFRVSELLSLKIGDVVNPDGSAIDSITVKARNTKTKIGRTQMISQQTAIELARFARKQLARGYSLNSPLFVSRTHDQDGKIKPITRQRADAILKKAFALLGLFRGYASHTLRKTFARRMYSALQGKLELVQMALGHRSITSTMSYLSFSNTPVFSAAREMLF